VFQKNDIILCKRTNYKARVNWVKEDLGIFGYTFLNMPNSGNVVKLEDPFFELIERAKPERVRRVKKEKRVRRIKRVKRTRKSEKKETIKRGGFFN